jgi:hypothetical protein
MVGMTRTCFLEGYGDCNGKITGEHYISRTVLDAIGTDSIQIGGLRWQPEEELQQIGISALVSNILCGGHNSAWQPSTRPPAVSSEPWTTSTNIQRPATATML